MASNKIGTVLSENYLSYVFWPICLILGIPINSYCLYHLIKKTKLNGYIKAIMVKNMIIRGCIFLLFIKEGIESRIQYRQQESNKYQKDRKNTNTASIYRTRANKGRGFYSKIIFWAYALWCIVSKIVHSPIVKIDKIQ